MGQDHKHARYLLAASLTLTYCLEMLMNNEKLIPLITKHTHIWVASVAQHIQNEAVTPLN